MTTLKKSPGIYKIVNCCNDKVYVGKAEDVDDCWKMYIPYVDLYKDDSPELYKDMKKHDWSSFFFLELERCPIEKLDERRDYWINKLHTNVYGYNKTIANKGKIDIRVYSNFYDEYLRNLGYQTMWIDMGDSKPMWGHKFYKLVNIEDYNKEIELVKDY